LPEVPAVVEVPAVAELPAVVDAAPGALEPAVLVLALEPLPAAAEPMLAFVSIHGAELLSARAVAPPAVADEPVVPVAALAESPRCRHPVTVTVRLVELPAVLVCGVA
jgi:hypothetical protein